MPKTMLDILDEFEETYVKHPENRGISSGEHCQYLTPDGKMCAVGRYCLEPGYLTGSVDAISYRGSIDHHLRAEYRGHPIDFWQDLQNLHDHLGCWGSGYSSVPIPERQFNLEGYAKLADLREKYGTNWESYDSSVGEL